jgi:hypothetical protein
LNGPGACSPPPDRHSQLSIMERKPPRPGSDASAGRVR